MGCTEEGVGFTKPIHSLAKLMNVTPGAFPRPGEEQGQGVTLATAATVAAVAGLAVGAGARIAKNIGKAHDEVPRDAAKPTTPEKTP